MRPIGNIDLQLKKVGESLDRLGGVVVDLVNHLKPILREDCTKDAASGKEKPPQTFCPLADDLDSINNSIQHQVEVLVSIIQRSEL